MGIIYGLLAAILWGSGDVLINRLTTHVGTTRALVGTQLLSLLFWVVYAIVIGFPGKAPAQAWEIAAMCGVFHVAGLVLTYRAFEIGTLSIVSPIASAFAIVTAVLALVGGERPDMSAIAGAFMLILGVIIVTRASSGGGGNATLKGVGEALGSAIAFGVMFWQIDRVAPNPLGMAWPLALLKLMACSYSLLALTASKRKGTPPTHNAPKWEIWALAAGVAITDSLAWVTWILGTTTSYTSVVTALASLFSVVTVVLAAILLKERLNRPQYIGIAAVFLGILLVSLPSGMK